MRIALPGHVALLAVPATLTLGILAGSSDASPLRGPATYAGLRPTPLTFVPHAPGRDPWRGLRAGSAQTMQFPVRGRVSYGGAMARFGVARPGHAHEGQDVFARPGTPLVAVSDAIVLESGGGDARGNYVALYSPSRRLTFAYFHMRAPSRVPAGRRVRAGTRVGSVGCTGRCSGPHLHFEVHRGRGLGGRPIDPLPLLRRAARGRGHAA